MKIVVMKINFPFAMMGGWVGWSYSGFFYWGPITCNIEIFVDSVIQKGRVM